MGNTIVSGVRVSAQSPSGSGALGCQTVKFDSDRKPGTVSHRFGEQCGGWRRQAKGWAVSGDTGVCSPRTAVGPPGLHQ